MCRLLAFASVNDTTIQSLLTPDEFENYRQLSTLHGDGWGAAWWSRSTGIRQLNSVQRAVDDDNFLATASGEKVAAGIVHLRWATSGLAVCIENTHPFAAESWRFAHNGAIPGHERLLEFLSPDRRAALNGTTDSEIYFQLILTEAERRGDVVEGLREAIRLVRATCGLGSLNCLLLSEGRMIAVQAFDRTPAPVASILDSVGGAENLPEGHDENYYRLRYRVSEGYVVVSSTGVGVDGWTLLGDDAIVDVEVASGRVLIRRLGDGEVESSIDLRASAVA
jgi:predicted glutamine amidotransferase